MAKQKPTVADYLIRRLGDFGVEHLFTVPGDYAGPFLSAVDQRDRLDRVGVTNERVAGYAADAYARLRGTGPLPHSRRSLERAVDLALARLKGATKPVIWAGVEVQRFGLQEQLERVIRVTGLPWTSDLLGKSVLAEGHPGFMGVFDGASAVKNVMELFDASNWVLGLGNLVTDDFAVWVQKHYDHMILAYGNSVRVGRKTYADVPLAAFMERIEERLTQRSYRAPAGAAAAIDRVPTPGERARVRFAALRPMLAGGPAAAAAPPPGAGTAAAEDAAAPPELTYDLFFERMKDWVDDSMVLLADTSIALYS